MAANAITFDMQLHAAKYNGACYLLNILGGIGMLHVTAAWCSLVFHGTGVAADRALPRPSHSMPPTMSPKWHGIKYLAASLAHAMPPCPMAYMT